MKVGAGGGLIEPSVPCGGRRARWVRRRAHRSGVHVAVALVWLWRVDGVALTTWDVTGVSITLVGMGVIALGGWQS